MSDHPAIQTGMPEWLRRHLEVTTGGFRAARWNRCRHCHELTLGGADGDICGVRVEVDPTPLTPTQEGWCAIHGRRTSSLEIIGKRISIWARDPYAIALPSSQPIVPHHECGNRYPGFLLRPPAKPATTDRPPF